MYGKKYGKALNQTPTQEETIRKIEVEKQWTWEVEKLMEAYSCKKNMDEFKRKSKMELDEVNT